MNDIDDHYRPEWEASTLDAIDRLSTIRADVNYLADMFGIRRPDTDELVALNQAISHLIAGAELARTWPDGSPVGDGPLTARQVLLLVETAQHQSPLLAAELAARYGSAIQVRCTYCGAHPDEWCRTKSKRIAWDPHADRRRPLRSVPD